MNDLNWATEKVISSEFQVKQRLGQGGAGVVYLVERISDHSLFAVKRMRKGIRWIDPHHWLTKPQADQTTAPEKDSGMRGDLSITRKARVINDLRLMLQRKSLLRKAGLIWSRVSLPSTLILDGSISD